MLSATKEMGDDWYLSPLHIVRGAHLSVSYRLVNHVLAYIYVDLSSQSHSRREKIGQALENKYSQWCPSGNPFYHCLWDSARFGYSIGYRSNPRKMVPLLNSVALSLHEWDPTLARDLYHLRLKYLIVEKWLGVSPLVDWVFGIGWGLSAADLFLWVLAMVEAVAVRPPFPFCSLVVRAVALQQPFLVALL